MGSEKSEKTWRLAIIETYNMLPMSYIVYRLQKWEKRDLLLYYVYSPNQTSELWRHESDVLLQIN